MKKKLVALLLCLVMALSLIPTTAWAANSTVVLHPSEGNTVTGVKVRVGSKISGYKVTSISGYDITVDLGKYNVSLESFRLPYAKDIWYGVDNNKVDYISWAGTGSVNKSEGDSVLLANGGNSAYYYFKGSGGGSDPQPGDNQVTATVQVVYTDANKSSYTLGESKTAILTCTSTPSKYHTHGKNCSVKLSGIHPDTLGFTIDSKYTWIAWNKGSTPNLNSTLKPFAKNTTDTTNFNTGNKFFLIYQDTTPAPVAPEKPTPGVVAALGNLVNVYCTREGENVKTSNLISGTYTIGDVKGDATSGYTCTITITKPSEYIPADHEQDPEKENDLTITLVWNNGTWGYAADAADTAIIYVKCIPAPVAPNAPTWDDLETLLAGKVNMVCETENNHSRTYGLLENTQDYTVYTVSEVAKNADDVYTCTVTIINDSGVSKYIAKYNDNTNSKHEAGDTANDLTITLEYDKENSNWIATDTAIIYVKCIPAPVAPNAPTWDDLETLLAGKVNMVCETNNSHNHTYGLLENTYNTSEVAKNANGVYTCTVTIINDSGVSEYIAKYNDDTNSKHEAGDTANDLTITLEYDKENSKWVVSATDNTAIIYVKCTPEPEAPEAPTAEDLKSIRGVLVDCLSDPQAITHSDMAFPFFENTYEVGDVVLDQETDQYTCVVTVTDPQAYVNSYDFMLGLMLGKTDLIHHVMQPTTQTPTVTLVYDETNGWQRPERTYATITAICMIKAPTAEDLENYKLVKVDCDTRISHGEKSYALLDGTFSAEVTDDGDGNFQCVITITQEGAKEYVKQYGKDLGKTHSLKKLEDATITLKYKDNSWVVDDNDSSASILAKCSTGSNTTTGTDDGKTVTSQKTFDAGIALYAGLSILSLTGGALVIRKRKEF